MPGYPCCCKKECLMCENPFTRYKISGVVNGACFQCSDLNIGVGLGIGGDLTKIGDLTFPQTWCGYTLIDGCRLQAEYARYPSGCIYNGVWYFVAYYLQTTDGVLIVVGWGENSPISTLMTNHKLLVAWAREYPTQAIFPTTLGPADLILPPACYNSAPANDYLLCDFSNARIYLGCQPTI